MAEKSFSFFKLSEKEFLIATDKQETKWKGMNKSLSLVIGILITDL